MAANLPYTTHEQLMLISQGIGSGAVEVSFSWFNN
jgi:hypothetical protein